MTNIVTESKLKSLLYLSRKRGEKIVMTNGVFDILHVGHISYLSHAKKLGDKLIVAVNSDSSAQRLKGKNRPVNSLAHRMIMLSALKTVDWVIPFYEDTPYRLIVNILPHYLVKGGDYKINEIIGSKEVIENGGYIKILPFKSNCSTTRIINIIKRNL